MNPEYSTTSTLTLVYDTRAPILVTNVAAISSSTFVPGNVISLTFSEDLQCAMPYLFQAELRSGGTTLYEVSNAIEADVLPLRCVGAMMSIQIPTGIAQKLSSVTPVVSQPAQLTIRLANVFDLYKNKIKGDLMISFKVNTATTTVGR